MKQFPYDTAEVLIFDPVAGNRTATRASLFTLGFRRIELTGTLTDFSDALLKRPIDLAICEYSAGDPDLFAIIQSLRQDHTAMNPFSVIVTTLWQRNADLARRAIDSGADDVLLRPFSTENLGQRIAFQIEQRKKFVISGGYVGPDRRKDAARPPGDGLFTPPNSLQIKVKARLGSEEANVQIERALHAARQRLGEEKFRCDALRLGVQYRLATRSEAGRDERLQSLQQLRDQAAGIGKLAVGQKFKGVADCCHALGTMLSGLDDAPSAQQKPGIEQLIWKICEAAGVAATAGELQQRLDAMSSLHEARRSARGA